MKVFDGAFDLFCFISAITYTLVPVIFLYQLKNNVLKQERLSIIAILCLFLNGLIYFVRSVVYENEEIDVRDFCNLAGAQLGFLYLIIYLKYLYYKTDKTKFYIPLVIIILSSAVIILIEYLIKDNDLLFKIVEWIAILFNIFEYLPMGFNFIYLIKNQISEKYTLLGGFVGLINTAIWLLWAIYRGDKIHSLIANIFGLILCISQCLLFFIFRKEETDENKNEEEENESINDKNDSIPEDKEDDMKNKNNSQLRGSSDLIDQLI